MGLVSEWSVFGVPVPARSEFRRTSVRAKGPGTQDREVWWTLAVYQPPTGGPVLEARPGVGSSTWVGWARPTLGFGSPDYIQTRAWAAVDDPDQNWSERKVRRCQVGRCLLPIQMTAAATVTECAQHQARSILACHSCGRPDLLQTAGRERLFARGLCWDCGLWFDRFEDDHSWFVVACDGGGRMVYSDGGRKGGDPSLLGHGGERFVVRDMDGIEVADTNNLWCGGKVPAHMEDLFPVNATLDRKDAR